MENAKILKVTSFGEKDGESYSVTLQPMNISMVISPVALVERQGMALHKATVKFMDDGGSAELYINGDDLRTLEGAVGFYDNEY